LSTVDEIIRWLERSPNVRRVFDAVEGWGGRGDVLEGIIRETKLEAPAVVRILDGLRDRGLVERVDDVWRYTGLGRYVRNITEIRRSLRSLSR